MTSRPFILLLAATALAAAGQLLFKVGASGRVDIVEFVNPWIATGLLAYGISTLIWIYALSMAPLTVVYPFTALTFVLTYLLGVSILNEPLTKPGIAGIALILIGLFLVIRN